MATCAVALDSDPETSQWLDWVFAPDGGALPGLIVGNLDRDGISPESGPGYALMWGANFAEVASLIADYPKYKGPNLYRDFPQFKAWFTAAWRMCALGVGTPNIGDSGATGSVQRVAVKPDVMAEGYRYTRDPQLAIAAYRANGNSARGLGRDIFADDPDTLAAEIERIGRDAGPRPVDSTLLSGYGLASLESPANGGTAISCYFGRTIMHGHLDLLNFDLFAFGKWLAPDHGYPEFATAWPHRTAVTMNTLAHNTVVIDQQPQQRHYGGKTRLFSVAPGMTVMQADAPGGYPQAKRYTRTMMLIDTPAGNAYAIDIFDVVGGRDHVYSFHGPAGAITASGLSLIEQQGGTYAGPDVPFKSDKGPVGYSWFYNVRRDPNPPAEFLLDWQGENGKANLRFHALSQCDDIALADADPPQNKPGNPRRLGYALLHRAGDGELSSRFVAVIEPYHGEPFIRAAGRNNAAGDDTITVELIDGSIDQVVLRGDGEIEHRRSVAGAQPRVQRITRGVAGIVATMNRDLNGGGWIWLNADIPADLNLPGRYIHIDNDNERDASYLIHSAERDGNLTKIHCGDISFIRGFAGETITIRGKQLPRSYERGFVYDFEEGASFRIPLHHP
jgi:oligo-alginate lyase